MTKQMIRKIAICSAMLLPTFGTQAQASDSEQLKGNTEIRYEGSDVVTPPVDPEDPAKEMTPGGEIVSTEGPLRLDFIPKLTFGSQAISNKDQVYFADAQTFNNNELERPNYLQVTDNRGTLSGWSLSVRQETQFKNEAGKSELKGAVLSFDRQKVNSTFAAEYRPSIVKDAIKIEQMGVTYPIAVAEDNHGMGTWTVAFGSTADTTEGKGTLIPKEVAPKTSGVAKNKNSAISLFVPGKSPKEPVQYTTVLTWTLSELT